MDAHTDTVTDLTPILRLTRDLKTAARSLTNQEARFLVDAYYQMQDERIRAANRERASAASGEPNTLMTWMSEQRFGLERQVGKALDHYSAAQPVGAWARSIVGIGPVISAGLLAHIDINKAPTAGHIWRFAGLDPTVRWEKGQKCPWNQHLKRLCWLVGESFVKVSGHDRDVYGKVYKTRKDQEAERNAAGAFASQAAEMLVRKKFGADTQARAAYEKGILPPAHIHARAKRYAVKLFLAHLQHVWWETATGTEPARPFIIEHGGHVHFIAPPNWPMA